MTRNEKEIARERRKQRRFEALGANYPCCVQCGVDDWRCLELHEPGGREFCDLSVIVCRNCHRKLEDGRKDHPSRLSTPPTNVERIAHALLGLADFFEQLVKQLRIWANALLDAAKNGLATKGATP